MIDRGPAAAALEAGAQLAVLQQPPQLSAHVSRQLLSAAELHAALAPAPPCRVVVTDHQHFVLVNVYAPNAGDRPDRSRLPFKLRWLAALKRKVDAVAAAGREVSGARACGRKLSAPGDGASWGLVSLRAARLPSCPLQLCCTGGGRRWARWSV